MRTIDASTSTATASPTPNICTTTAGVATKLRNTLIMISAADVMTRAVVARPDTTAARVWPVRSYSSRIRVSRKTW